MADFLKDVFNQLLEVHKAYATMVAKFEHLEQEVGRREDRFRADTSELKSLVVRDVDRQQQFVDRALSAIESLRTKTDRLETQLAAVKEIDSLRARIDKLEAQFSAALASSVKDAAREAVTNYLAATGSAPAVSLVSRRVLGEGDVKIIESIDPPKAR